MKKLLICGDSFSAQWSDTQGWPNYLKNNFEVTNMSQPGCSEYKIQKQLDKCDLEAYDNIIVSHTSPYRLYIKNHPVHLANSFHKDSCLIYNDIKDHAKYNAELITIITYFEKYFDIDYAIYMHNLLLRDIENKCPDNTLHISHIDWSNLHVFKNYLNFEVFKKHRGFVNHYDPTGNEIVYRKILERLTNE